MSSQLSQLHRLIASNYNLDELRTLCFDLGVEFENLGGVETRDGKARELILLLGREHRIEQLLKAVQNTRPVLLETTGLTPELINPETYYLELADFETASSSPKTRRKHLTILLLVFGVVIILILSFIIAQPFMEDDDSIELVDVLVLVDKGLPVIEFKVRNIGDEVAFLKAAEFEILESRDISECTSYLAWPVSYVYDVELPIEVPLNSFVQRVNISQAVPANDVDRFQFKIGNKIAGMPGGSIIYQLKIRILYNKNSEIVSDEVLIMVPHTIGTLDRSGASGECLERTYENGIYMLNLQGDRSQELHDFRYDLEALRKELDIVRPTETPRPTRLSIGSQVPHFDLTTFDGQVYSLSDYRGDIIVINFRPCGRYQV